MTLLKKENVTNTADAVFNQKNPERSLLKDSFLIKDHLQRKFINYNRIRPKRGVRVVYGAILEGSCGGNSTVSSNLIPSVEKASAKAKC